jgi:hypothetical protein
MTNAVRWAALLFVSVAGCATSGGLSLHVQPIYQYRGYGEYLPDRDAQVLATAKEGKADPASVKFLQETLPEGVEMTQNTLGVKDGYGHHLLGKLAYSTGALVTKLDLIARVKQVAAAAGGDAAIGMFLLTDQADYTKAQGVEAVILKLDPRFKGGSKAPPTDEKKKPASKDSVEL